MNLDKIYEEINQCSKCELHKSRIVKHAWRGNPRAKIIFIGEAFGAEEQKRGKPFVGRAGRLLDKLLGEVGLDINEVFFSNILHCRPPNNRDPLIHEIRACQNYLIEEIRQIKPKLIVTLGRVAGSWWNHHGDFKWGKYYPKRRWLPMYHPAYLSRRMDKVDQWKGIFKSVLIRLFSENQDIST